MYYVNSIKKEIHINCNFILACKNIKGFADPIEAAKYAFSLKKELDETFKNINVFIYNSKDICVLKTKLQYKLLHWADDEYKRLRKCQACRRILGQEEYRIRIYDNSVYCSENCRAQTLESLQVKDNDESEFDL